MDAQCHLIASCPKRIGDRDTPKALTRPQMTPTLPNPHPKRQKYPPPNTLQLWGGEKLPPFFVPIASTPTFDTVISSRLWWSWYNMARITIKIVVVEDAVDFGLHLTGTDRQASKLVFYHSWEQEFGNGGRLERGMKKWRWKEEEGGTERGSKHNGIWRLLPCFSMIVWVKFKSMWTWKNKRKFQVWIKTT